MLFRCFILLLSLYASLSAYQVPPMDPETRKLLDTILSAQAPAVETLPIEQTRKMVEDTAVVSTIRLASISDKMISGKQGDFQIRIYTPFGKGPFPVFFFIHGGGWVFGTLHSYDNFCRKMATQAGVMVVSVGYRVAPEHRFPVPVEDCYVALKWVSENIQNYQGIPSQIAIGGDSAGGNLAAACTLLAKEDGMKPCIAQVLIYPVTSAKTDSQSYEQFGKNYFLTKSMMEWFINLYLANPKDADNPLVSPILAKDLTNLPPAYVLLANYDPLYSEGLQYAELLKRAHVPVTVVEYPSIHGFVTESCDLSISKQATADIAAFLKNSFQGQHGKAKT